MTAYRFSTTAPDAPFVNPNLERALLEYYAKNRRRKTVVPFAMLVAVTFAAALWVVVFHPRAGWFSPMGLAAVCFAIAATSQGLALLRELPTPLLDRIRTGIPIRQVQRETDTFRVRYARSATGVGNDVPTICVDFVDGSVETLPSLGDLRQLSRIEYLLKAQMEQGGRGQARAS